MGNEIEAAGSREDETVTLSNGAVLFVTAWLTEEEACVPGGSGPDLMCYFPDEPETPARPFPDGDPDDERVLFDTLLSLQRRSNASEEIDPETGLKGCPFCGGDPEVRTEVEHGGMVRFVWCEPCRAQGPVGETEWEARELWNRRTAAPSAPSEPVVGQEGRGA